MNNPNKKLGIAVLVTYGLIQMLLVVSVLVLLLDSRAQRPINAGRQYRIICLLEAEQVPRNEATKRLCLNESLEK